MKKELKRQIKQDEFAEGIENTWGWLQLHRSEVRVTLAVVLLVAAGAAALTYFQASRGRDADEAFGAALDTFHATVATEQAEGAEKGAGPVYATASEKYKKAAAAFDGVERKYASLPAGIRAKYYGALCRAELGETAEAQKTLGEIAARKDLALESGLARLALADLLRRTGQLDKAVDAYRQIVDDTSLALPRDYALLSLASMLEGARRIPEAKAAYKRLADEFPTSVYQGEARRKSEFLETAREG